MKDERVDKRVYDQVVFAVGCAEEMSAIIEVPNHPAVLIRLVGMVADADVLDNRVDFNGINLFNAKTQGMRYVVTRSCANNQSVPKRWGAAMLLKQMDERVRRAGILERHHGLMANRIDENFPALLIVLDSVVGRPTSFMLAVSIE